MCGGSILSCCPRNPHGHERVLKEEEEEEEEEEDVSQPPIRKDIFEKLLKLATQGLFIYKDRMYQQTEGVIMGSPLGPTLANFFMADLETKLLNTPSPENPKIYLRYVDDIYAIFQDSDSCTKFLKKLNCQHPNIKFTVEKATNTLPFLDVEIKITDSNTFESWTWRKKTHTGLMLNFTAVCPSNWKIGLISCLLHRAKRVCSNKNLFTLEIEKLRKMFVKNGYPLSFFNKALERFSSDNQNKTQKFDHANKLMLKIPFLGRVSKRFATQISKLIKQKFEMDVRIIYNTYKVGSYFNLKS